MLSSYAEPRFPSQNPLYCSARREYFIFSCSFFFLAILFYIYIYSCILFMLVDGWVHLAVEQRKSRSPIIHVATASSWSCRNCCWVTVGNTVLELAWRALASSHKSFVFMEPSERTNAKVGEKFCKMWASLLLVAAGKRGWVVFVPNCSV
jgi:hypothetical protein